MPNTDVCFKKKKLSECNTTKPMNLGVSPAEVFSHKQDHSIYILMYN